MKGFAVFDSINQLHEKCMAEALSLENALLEFRSMIKGLSLAHGAPQTAGLTVADVQLLTAFLTAGYLSHYSLYLCCVGQTQEADKAAETRFVQTACAPPPLSSGSVEMEENEDSSSAVFSLTVCYLMFVGQRGTSLQC
jgi:hypothetical protein